MALNLLLQALSSLKEKVLSLTGTNSANSDSIGINEASLQMNGAYAENGIPAISKYIKNRKRRRVFSPKPIVMAMTLVIASLFFVNTALAAITSSPTSVTVPATPVGTAAGTSGFTTSFVVKSSQTFNSLTATAPSGFQVSLSATSGYGNSVTFTPNSGSGTTVFVALTATDAAGSFSGNSISLVQQFQTTVNVAVSGIVVGPIVESPGSLSGFTTSLGIASGAQTFTVSDVFLATGILITPPTGYEVSTNGTTFTSTVTVGTAGAALGTTTISIRLASTATAGTHNGNVALTSSPATTVNLPAVSGTVTSSSITVGNPASGLTTTYGTASGNQSFTVAGTGLTTGPGTVTVTAPTGFEVSTTGGAGTFSGSVGLSYTGTSLTSTTVFLRLAATAAAGAYNGKSVTATQGSTSGTNTIPNSTVSQATLSVTGAAANNKVYDATATATLSSIGTISGTLFNGDNPTLVAPSSVTFSGNANNTSVGTGKSVAATGYTLSGTGAANYAVTSPSGLTANITVKTLTITGLTGSNKVYDGTTTAAFTGTAALSGNLDGTNVVLGGSPTAAFASATVANGITINVSGYSISGTASGNYTLTQPTLTANITVKTITVTGLSGVNKVYDRTLSATFSGTAALSGVVAGDVSNVNLGGSPTAAFVSANVGTGITVNISGYSISGTAAGNYLLTQPTPVTANITVAPVTISGLVANNKQYDGTNTATFAAGATLVGVMAGDVGNVTLVPSGTFASPAIGTGIAVTSTSTLTGSASGNYVINPQPTGLTANISGGTLTISGISIVSKVYDRTTGATITGTPVLNGVAPADNGNVTISGTPTAAFGTATVANGKVVTVSGYTITGSAAGNYTLTQPTGLTGNITAKSLTVTGLTTSDRVYDGDIDASIGGSPTLTGIVSGDGGNVTLDLSGLNYGFASPNAGNNVQIIISGLALAGSASGNYSLVSPTILTANITPAPLTVQPNTMTVNSKVYDGTTAGTTTGGTLQGIFTNTQTNILDDVSIVGTGNFNSPAAGLGMPFTSTSTLTGAAAANYTLTQPTGLTGNITQKPTSVVGITAVSRPYDGTNVATLTGTPGLVGSVGLDVVFITGTPTATFPDANIGTGKTVTVTGYTLGGRDANNYSLTQPTLSANITPLALTVTGVTANNKQYDRTTAATLNTGSAVLNGVVAVDNGNVSLSGTPVGVFTTATAGNNIGVTVTGYTISGGAIGNYTITQPTGITANITPIALTLPNAAVTTKTYDGTTTATITGTLTGILSPDVVTLTGTGVFATSAVGTGIAVSNGTLGLGGAQAADYTLTQPVGLTGTITGKALTITGISISNKVYDATTNATITGTAALNGVLAGDVGNVTLTGSTPVANFVTATVGTGKAVTITGYTLSGLAAGNYTVTQPTGLTANVTTATLSITGITVNKIYDRTTAVSTSGATLVGVPAVDVNNVLLSGGALAYSSANVGTRSISVTTNFTLTGSSASNYTLTQPTGLSGTISAKTLTISIGSLVANNKVYDGTTTATLASGTAGALNGIISGDNVTLSTNTRTWAFTDANVGNGKTVNVVSGYSLSGSAAGNYTLSLPATTVPALTANITAKPLTITGLTTSDKTYDGTTTATLGGTAVLNGVVAVDNGNVILGGTPVANFSDALAGNGKTITVTGYSISGSAIGNYSLSQPVVTSRNINKASLTITANNQSKNYGTPFTFLGSEYTNSALIGSDAISSVSFTSGGSAASAGVANSPYTIVPSAAQGTGLSNYTINYVNGTFTVNTVPLTITADNKSMNFGDPVPTLTASYAGFVNSETSANLTTKPSITTTGTSTSPAGPYPITAIGAVDANYAISYVPGVLTINTALVTFNPIPSQVYGTPDFNPGATSSSAATITYTSDNPAVATIVANQVHIIGVGTANITATNGSDTESQSLTVTTAPLTIKANDVTKTYGATLTGASGSFAFTPIGLVNSETVGSVTISYGAGSAASDPVTGSAYLGSVTPSAATGGTFTASNYAITYTSGNIIINPALLNVTATGPPKTYGIALTAGTSTTNFIADAGVNGETVTSVTLTPDAAGLSAGTPAGASYTVTPSLATGSGSFLASNYNITYTPFSGTVSKATLDITANSTSKTYGQTVTFAGTEFSTTGQVNGDGVSSVTLASDGAAATATVAGGPYAIVPSAAQGTGLDNYNLVYHNGTLTVNQATLDITANSTSKTYGQTVTFAGTEFSTTGQVNGDGVSSVTLASDGAAATATVAGGPYAIVPSAAQGTGLDNYNLVYHNGTLTVNQATLDITANSTSKTYGQTVTFAGTEFSTTGQVNGDGVSSVTLASDGAAAAATVAGGPYAIIPSAAQGTGLDNYNLVYHNGTLTVSKATLDITAVSTSKTYGQTVTFAGTEFSTSLPVNGDGVSSVSLASDGAAATATVAGGPYAIVPSAAQGTGLDNYNLVYHNGTLTVNQATLDITANSTSKTYGQTVTFAGTEFSTTGQVNGDGVSSVTLASDGAAATATVAGGPYAIVPSVAQGTGLDNYNLVYHNGTLTVNQATLDITANSTSKTYGQTVTFAGTEFSTTGQVNGDGVSSVTLASDGAAATATVAGGPYAIVPSAAQGTGLDNYNLVYHNGTLTVNQATLDITANSTSKTYGQTVTFAGTEFSTTGQVNGDGVSSVTLASDGAAATATVAGGPYAIVPSVAQGTGLDNYNLVYHNGTLTVNQATLDITANSTSKTYGQTVTFAGTEFSTTGQVNGDGVSSVTLASDGAAAAATVAGGPYAIIPSAAQGTGLDNYNLVYHNGTLTVSKATLDITAVSTSKTYGQTVTFAGTEFSTSLPVNGDGVSSVSLASDGAAATATVAGGPYAIVPSAAQGTGLDNYNLVYHNGTLTVNQATLDITANSTSKTYGQTVTFAGTEFSTTGQVNGDGVSSVTLASDGAAATATVAGGPYAIVPSVAQGTGLDNYNLVYHNGTLTVNQATLDITANSTSKTYGQTVTFAGTEFSTTGQVNGDGVSSVTLASDGAAATATVAGGPYAIVPSAAQGTGLDNYNLVYHNGTLTVNQATLDITANSTSKTYGQTVTFAGTEFSTTGQVNGDGVSSVTLASDGAAATATVAGGPYAIVPSVAQGTGLDNYNLVYHNGTLTVNQATLDITANSTSKTYGQTVTFAGTEFSTTGQVNGDGVSSVTLASDGAAAAATVAGGPYAIIPSAAQGTGLDNYNLVYHNGTLTVSKATLDITAVSTSKTYGQTVTFAGTEFSTSLPVNGDGVSSVSLASDGAAATATVAGGPYAIVPSAAQGTGLDNYNLVYHNGTLTVNQATLDITANSTSKTYGQTVTFAGTEFSTTGQVNGDGVSSVTLASDGAAATATVAGGPYAIVPSVAQGTGLDNYNLVYHNGTLTVNQATLDITANSTSKTYGQTVTFAGTEFSTTGQVNGDGVSSVTLASDGAAATATVAGGPYAIVPSAAQGTGLDNYNLVYHNGTLTVNQANLTITANPATKAYGTTLTGGAGSANFTTSPLANGETVGSVTIAYGAGSAATDGAGTYPGSVTASAATDGTFTPGNYNITYVAGDLTVTNATLLVITPDDQSRQYGAANPTFTVQYAGFVNNDTEASLTTKPTVTTTADANSLVGTYPITATGAVSPNYTISYSTGTLTVTPAPLTITANNDSKSYGMLQTFAGTAFTPTGLLNSDAVTSVTLASDGAAVTAGVGTYDIVPSAAVGTGLSNYAITYANGNDVVGQAILTIKANDDSKTYGASQTFAGTAFVPTGLLNSDAVSSVTLTSDGSAVTAPAATYDIVPSAAIGTGLSNYNIIYANGHDVVGQANLTITANDNSKTYGTSQTFAGTAFVPTGLLNSDAVSSVTLTSDGSAVTAPAGTYDIVPSAAIGSGLSNYNITYAVGHDVVGQANLTITANNDSKTYGASQTFAGTAFTPTGLLNSDAVSSVTLTSDGAAPAAAVGTYDIVPSVAIGTGLSNYNISYAVGHDVVGQANLTITANPATKAYGTTLTGAAGSANFTTSPLANGETVGSVTIAYGAGSASTDGAGTYPGSVTASAATGGTFTPANYNITYAPGNLIVTNAALLVITPDNQSRLYGAANPTFTVQYAGFVNNDTQASLTTQPIATTTADVNSPVGTYAITASGATSPNYTISYSTGTLTITPAPLTITAANKSKAYGDVLPTLTANYSGFVNGETKADLTNKPNITTTATASSPVGTYPITATGAVDDNYTISYVAGTLTVTPVALTITADSKSKAYGDPLPLLTASYSGFVNGDSFGSLDTQPSLNTTGNSGSPAGTYPITASGASDANYTISYAPGLLTVNTVPLTITADNKTKSFGAVNPPLTITYAGFVNGDAFTDLTPQPGISTTATTNSPVGPYPITVSGAGSNNYTFNYVQGTLTVSAVALTFGPIANQPYGTPDFDPGASSVATITYTSSNTSVATIVAGKVHIVAPGTTNITADNGSTQVVQSLTVTPAALTITANSASKAYGSANPALTVSYSGFVPGESSANLSTQPTITTTAVAGSSVGSYPITASGAVDANYTISYVAGSLTVNPVTLTVTADDQTKSYGSANPTLTVSYSGFVNGDTKASLTTKPTISTTATASSPAGSYPITAIGAVDPNYTFNYVAGNLTVTPVQLTITANDQTKNYGFANPTFTVTYSGFVNGDNKTSLTTQPTPTTTAVTSSPVGPYPITVSGAVDPNYTFSYVPGTLTVGPATLTITPNSLSKSYGAANPALTLGYSGFVNGDTFASLTTQATATTTATASSPIGTYVISATGASDANYNIVYNTGVLTVTPATLTITADNQTKAYGTANPTLTVTYSGFVNGETRASLTTRPAIVTTATTTSPAGPYPITASGAVDPNYTFVYAPGTLTVSPAVLTVTANNQSKNYGAVNPALTVTYNGFVNGDTQGSLTTQATATTTATTASGAGTYPITASGAVDPNYSFTYVPGTLTVNQAMLFIVANGQAKNYGSVNPTLTVSYSGFVNGDNSSSMTAQPVVATTALTNSPVGSYTITASNAVNANYNIAYIPGTLIINPVALFISADNKTKTFGSANPTLTASYSGFVNGDNSASLTTPPTITTTAVTNSPAGPYPITASGAVDANYTIAYSPGTLTVTGSALSFVAIPAKTYGAADFDPGASSTSPITYTSSNTSVATIVSGNIHIIGVGTSTITANDGITSSTQLLTVNPAVLMITANNQTKNYGAAIPALTVGYSGFVNGDNSTSLTTLPTASTLATAASPAGNYPITASGAVDANYTFNYIAGNLAVNPVGLTITANSTSKIYGAANPLLTVGYSGFVNGDNANSLTTAPTPTTTAGTGSPVGSYPITASGAVDGNYTISYVAGALTVTQAPLTITADNQTKTAGTINPTLTVSYNGFVNGDNATDLTTAPTITTTAVTNSPAGPYPITASGAVATNYSISYVPGTLTVTGTALSFAAIPSKTYGAADFAPGATSSSSISYTSSNTSVATIVSGNIHIIGVGTSTITANDGITSLTQLLTVNPATLTITANSQTKNYGAAIPALTVGYSGFVNGDNSTSLTTLPTASTSATAASPVGNYPITASGAVDANYTFSYVAGNLAVNPVPLTITADNLSKAAGSVNPTLTVSYTGFVNGDNSASLTTAPTITTTAVTGSPAGPYPITASGAVDANYNISYVSGTLTVTGAALTFAPIPAKTYGAADFDPGATSSSSITYTSSNTSVATIVAGKIHILTVGSSTITANDGATSLTQLLTVNLAPLTITANSLSKNYGAVNPAFTVTYSGFVNGDNSANLSALPTVTTTAITGSSAGSYPLIASGAADANYTISYVPGSLTINPVALTITANNTSKTVGAVNPTLTVSYSGFVNGDNSTNLTTQPTITTTAVTGSPVGPYPITASGAVDGNYTISYVAGTLTVVPAGNMVFAAIPSKVYGTADFSPGATSTGTIAYTSSNTAVATIVSGNIHIIGVGTSTITANDGTNTLTQLLTVTPRALSIAAYDINKPYGTTLTFGPGSRYFFPTGLQNSETIGSVTIAYGTGLATTAPVGTYTGQVTVSAATGGTFNPANYTITYTTGRLIVNPVALTITANNQTKVVGAANPPLTESYAGFVAGDNSTSLTTQPTVTTTAVTGSPVGTYPITASGAGDPNYTINYTPGTLTVATGTLAFAAIPSKVYGTADFDPGASSTSSITYTSSNTAIATILAGKIHIVHAGTSTITATVGATSLTQLLTVTPASLVIAANNQTKVAGSVNPAFTVSYTGFVNGDNSASLTTPPTVTTTAVTGSPAGPYPITASGAVGANYTISYSPGTLTVTPGGSLIFAAIPSKVYGTADFAPGASSISPITYTSSNTSVATIVSGNIHIIGVGTSTITANDGTTSLTQLLTVTPASLTITAANASKNYGSANPALTVSYTGFVNGDTQASLTTQPTVTTTAVTGSPVNTYPITASGAVGANYTIGYAAGTLTVNKVALTITANNLTKNYGLANPTLTVGYTGFVNGDNSTSLTTQPTITTTAVAGSPVGPYPITASAAVDANYTISYVAGTLTVNPVALTITANNASKTVGAVNPTFTVSYTGFVNGDNSTSLTTQPTITTTAVTGSPAGPYPITASGAVDGNYTISYVAGTLTVSPAGGTLVFAAIPSKVYGTADFAPGATSTGTITYTSSNTAVATIVSGNIHIIGVGTSTITANDGTSTLTQLLTVTPRALTIAGYDINKPYGTTLTFGPGSRYFFPTGLQNGETIGSVTIAYGTALATTAPVGTYVGQVTVSAATGGTFNPANYTITYTTGRLIVNPVALTITANNQTKVAGAANPTLTVTYTGFVAGDNSTKLTTQPTITTTATAASPAGTYPITASGAVDPNYTITYASGTMTVTLAPLSIISVNNPNNTTITDDSEPVLRQALSPNGDGINDVLVIDNIEKYPDNRVVLMNRNGVEVYSTTGYDNVTKVFDGHSNINKAMQQPGTYFYMLEYKVNGELKRKTGYFIIKY